MESKIKGFLFKKLIDLVSQEKGPEGLSALEREVGTLKISFAKDYSVDLANKYMEVACKIIFGYYSDENLFKLGKTSASIYSTTPIGKTMLSLIGKDPKILFGSIPKLLDTISSGIKVNVDKKQDNQVKITIQDSPLNPSFAKGMLSYYLEYSNHKGEVRVNNLLDANYEFIVVWE